jgi:hypothetical protein
MLQLEALLVGTSVAYRDIHSPVITAPRYTGPPPVLQVELAIHCYHTLPLHRINVIPVNYFCTQEKKKGLVFWDQLQFLLQLGFRRLFLYQLKGVDVCKVRSLLLQKVL